MPWFLFGGDLLIYRGSTPIHTFVLPFDIENITNMYITYRQKGCNIIQKNFIDDFEDFSADIESREVSVSLSQKETLAFSCGKKYTDNIIEIQLSVLLESRSAVISDPIKDRVMNTASDFIMHDTTNRLTDSKIVYDGGSIDTESTIVYDGGSIDGLV